MGKSRQGELPGFEQKRIARIETWSIEYDKTRETIAGLNEQLKNQGMKLSEAIHAYAADVDHQKGKHGEDMLVYKRGDINAAVKNGKESVLVTIGEKTKSAEPAEEDEEAEKSGE